MNHSAHSIPRRHFLRASGVSVALPFLAGLSRPAKGAEKQIKRRFVAINLGLGFLTSNFTPTKAGRDYEPTKYLQLIDSIAHSSRSFLDVASQRRWRTPRRAAF